MKDPEIVELVKKDFEVIPRSQLDSSNALLKDVRYKAKYVFGYVPLIDGVCVVV